MREDTKGEVDVYMKQLEINLSKLGILERFSPEEFYDMTVKLMINCDLLNREFV